ncbi:MAG: hypothetical protein Q7J45_00900 [bacterium]|nr:hypothetical protein [bacterium]
MTATVLERDNDLPQSILTDFIGTTKHLERVDVVERTIAISSSLCYYLFVQTQRGRLRITLSKEIFEILREGDSIIVQYQKGRWTGALKGNILLS